MWLKDPAVICLLTKPLPGLVAWLRGRAFAWHVKALGSTLGIRKETQTVNTSLDWHQNLHWTVSFSGLCSPGQLKHRTKAGLVWMAWKAEILLCQLCLEPALSTKLTSSKSF